MAQQTDQKIIKFKQGVKELEVSSFDNDKEIAILITYLKSKIPFFLSPNEVNELITHLTESMQYIKEPVDILYPLIPIKLPSDEDIDKEAFQVAFDGSDAFFDLFIKGAKWMKEQILNQNK